MRLKTKLFIASVATMFLLWLGAFWLVQNVVMLRIDQMAKEAFEGANAGLSGMRKAHVDRMQQEGRLLMNIPELRALIAEQNYEISNENRASLKERLDHLEGVVGVSFVSVLDGRRQVIAQSRQAPWESAAAMNRFCEKSAQPAALISAVFKAVGAPSTDGDGTGRAEYGLWPVGGRVYHIVAIPLIFQADADAKPTEADGALILGEKIDDSAAIELASSHNGQITFFSGGQIVASSLPTASREMLLDKYRGNTWPTTGAFVFKQDSKTLHGALQEIKDPQSQTVVAQMLVSRDEQEGRVETKLLKNLALIMGAGVLAAAVGSFVISGAITRPVRALVTGVQKVAHGDLTVELSATRRDELGLLATSFNDMVVRLRTREELVRQVQEAQSASQAKSQFLANMSHEIRTPLNGVIGMAELLLGTELNPKQKRYADLVKTSGELLTSLINDILDFSKIEAGKLEIETIDFNLRKIVEDVIALLEDRASRKKLVLASDFERDVPLHVRGDPDRLRQILVNLINNAIKFTADGSVRVTVTTTPRTEASRLVRFAVTDTGIGIPPDRLDRLFKPFSQVDASTTRKFGGTGLGLAIVKQLAELMGGTVGVESRPSEGSTFWFTVTLQIQPGVQSLDAATQAAKNALEDSQKPTLAESESSRPKAKILVAEDNEVNQIVITELLKRAGYPCQVVENGIQAIDAYFAGDFGLILMDCQMPEMDGFEATRQIRQKEAGTGRRPVPIVALTANAMKGDRENCLAAGMDGYCAKPVDARHMLSTIAELLAIAPAGEPDAPLQDANPPIPGSSEVPVVNFDALFHRCMNRPEMVDKIIGMFERQAAREMDLLQKGVSQSDSAAVVRVAHSLKGAAATLSADRIAGIAAELEDLGRQHKLAGMEEQLARLREEIFRCVEYLPQVRAMAARDALSGARDGETRS